MARIQMFTKSPGGEFSYPGRPMFGDFPPSGGEEHEVGGNYTVLVTTDPAH